MRSTLVRLIAILYSIVSYSDSNIFFSEACSPVFYWQYISELIPIYKLIFCSRLSTHFIRYDMMRIFWEFIHIFLSSESGELLLTLHATLAQAESEE